MNKDLSLVFATNNQHKLDEVRQMLDGLVEVKSLADIGFYEDIPENEDTFEGNALVKARVIYQFCGLPCIADDSGLKVEALGGEPGVYSARYAGVPKNDENNLRKVLQQLEGSDNRRAAFVTVLAYISNGLEYVFEGVVPGTITKEKRGSHGFGYDPVFMPDGHDRTFAEMIAAEKNALSHRARAVAAFKEFYFS
jgi:XTP/dITP diphosphohydrolase